MDVNKQIHRIVLFHHLHHNNRNKKKKESLCLIGRFKSGREQRASKTLHHSIQLNRDAKTLNECDEFGCTSIAIMDENARCAIFKKKENKINN